MNEVKQFGGLANRNVKVFVVFVLCLICSLFYALPVRAEGTAPRPVCVGVEEGEGFFVQDESEVRSGYGYDLLQKMLVYADWQYTYVTHPKNTDLEALFSALKNGSLDMLLCAQRDETLENDFSFSESAVCYHSLQLMVKTGNHRYSVNNFTAWNGITVGFVAGDAAEDAFKQYAEEKGFRYTAQTYADRAAMDEALQNDRLDLAVAPNFEKVQEVWVLDDLNKTPLYIAVRKNDTALMDEINNALDELQGQNSEYLDQLYRKYYSPELGNSPSYNEAESEFLQECQEGNRVYRALINPDRKPLSYYENGEIKGLLTEICQLIFERSGLTVEFIVTQNRDEYIAAMPQADFICDFTGEYGKAEKNGYLRVGSYYSSTTSKLQRKDYDGSTNRCALVGNTISGWLRENLTDAEFVSFDSTQDCMQAVIDNKADYLYSYTRCVQEWVYADITNSLVVVPDNHQTTDFSIAVNANADRNLTSILLKSINTITADDISALADSYTYYEKANNSLLAMIYQQPVFFGICVLVLAFLAFGTVLSVLVWRQRKSEVLKNHQLSAALQQAQNADRARTEFFARMSHDMRTPMNGILGLLALSRGEKDAVVLQDNLAKMQQSGQYLLSLINDSLNYEKVQSGHITLQTEVIQAKNLLAACSDMAKQNIDEENITFALDSEGVDLARYVRVDVLCMQKIFLNLLSNAFKFTPSGGTVTVKIRVLCRTDNIVHTCITVTDTGIGMSKDFLENGIFKPFSQESNEITPLHESSGLGLSIVKQICDALGAHIQVDSTLGVGTSFAVEMDIELAEAPVATPATHKESSNENAAESLAGLRVLQAEDHALNAQIATRLLEKAGCKVWWAKDGQEALTLFGMAPANEYDVVLMDIRMPNMDGIEATRKIRALPRTDAVTVPILAVTANVYEQDVQSYLEAGMNACLAKPLVPQTLYEVIAKEVKHRKADSQPAEKT